MTLKVPNLSGVDAQAKVWGRQGEDRGHGAGAGKTRGEAAAMVNARKRALHAGAGVVTCRDANRGDR